MRLGTIARLIKDRGFGFLRDDMTGTEYFFHKTTVLPTRHDFDELKRGTCVQFEIDEGASQNRAATVQALRQQP